MLEITQDLPLGHPGFRFWAGHQVADIPGELFVTPSFYPGKASPSPPPRSVVLLYGDSESGQRSLSTFSRPDGKKLFFFSFLPPTYLLMCQNASQEGFRKQSG